MQFSVFCRAQCPCGACAESRAGGRYGDPSKFPCKPPLNGQGSHSIPAGSLIVLLLAVTTDLLREQLD